MSLSVLIVDARVANPDDLLAHMEPGTELLILEGDQDGLLQISRFLAGRAEIAALHIVSHGAAGTLYLGATPVSGANLADYRSVLGEIGTALSAGGDILLYGCDVAAGATGRNFIEQLSRFTGADVAASRDTTGAVALGGNWVLEAGVGAIETTSLTGQVAGLLGAPTFNVGDGIVNADLGSATHRDYPASLLVQTDGKLIVVGGAGWQWMVDDNDVAAVRYNADGSLDTSFGSNGKVLWDAFGVDANEAVTEAKLLADGKILIVGNADSNAFLARLNSDGSPDTEFGTGGVIQITTAIADSGDSIKTLSDGSILIAGTAQGSNEDFALIHVLADGTPDPDFGINGVAVLDMNSLAATGWDGSSDSLYDVTTQSDGKIITVGRVGRGPYLFQDSIGVINRWNTDGSLDTSFGDGDGFAVVPLSGAINPSKVEVLTDGKILTSGVSYGTPFLARFNSDGTPDTSFGTESSGVVLGQAGTLGEFNYFAHRPYGNIVVAGTDGIVSRFTADGVLDTSFGTNGVYRTGLDYITGVEVLADGKIVVAGSLWGSDLTPVWNEITNDFAVVRINADGTPDAAFGADSTLANSLTLFTENGAAVQLDANVQVVDAELAAGDNYAGASVTLNRHGDAHSDDVFSAGDSMSALTEGSVLSVFGTAIGTVTQNAGGTLVLTFDDGATQYLVDTALQQIKYSNSNDMPPTAVQIEWTFSDGSLTTSDSTTVRINATNDAPTVTVPSALSFFEDVPGAITGISVAEDPDGPAYPTTPSINLYLSSGTLNTLNTLNTNGSSSDVIISVASINNITLIGTQVAINAYIADGNVIFTTDTNATSDVTLTVATGDSGDLRQVFNTTLTITPVDDQPITFAGGTLEYTENAAPAAIDTSITLSDADSGTLNGATVRLSAGFTAGDQLSFSNTETISGSYDASTGILTLTGTADFATYQTALRTVGYHSSSDAPTALSTTRTVTWSIPASDDAVEVTSTIEVTAVNDAPSLSVGDASASLMEAGGVGNADSGTASSRIVLTREDAETNAGYVVDYLTNQGWSSLDDGLSYRINGLYGSATLTLASDYLDYSLDNTLTATQVLEARQRVSESFSLMISDGLLTTVNTATFSISGANDAPTLATPTAITRSDTSADDTFALASGTLAGNDVDSGAALTYGIDGGSVASGIATRVGSYGSLSVNTGSGAYTFTPNDTAIEALKTNTSETYTVTVSDGTLSANASYTVNLIGANDATAFGGTLTGSVAEDGTATAGGTLSAGDRDTGDAVITVQTSRAGNYGVFDITASGAWSYRLNNSAANVQALAAAHSVTDTLNVATAGGATQTVVITIAGANDAPTLATPTAITRSDTRADDTFAVASGTLAGTDVDSGAALTYGISGGSVAGGVATRVGSYGSLSVNTGSGAYTFTPNDAAIEARKTNTSETYTVTVSDGTLSANASYRVNLIGANDPTTFNGVFTGAVTEDGTATAGGTLRASDRDSGDAVLVTQNNQAGSYGRFNLAGNGTWTYGLTNSASSVQQLGAGQIGQDIFTVMTAGGTSRTVTLNITGANDAPTLALAIPDKTTYTRTALGYQIPAATFRDVDSGDSLSYRVTRSDGSALPSWLGFNAATRTLSGTPTNAQIGTLDLRVTATDSRSASVSDTFRLTVSLLSIDGGPGNDSLGGTSSGDLMRGLGGNDRLRGLAGNDTLEGGDGNDTLDGGTGLDSMTGGAGNDTYIVDNAGDRIMEAADQGNDLVQSSLNHTLGANMEELQLLGSSDISAIGNSLDNILRGNAAGNVLDGRIGADTLIGGNGHDTYWVDNVGDQVVETENGGSDVVLSSVRHTLANHVEGLFLEGAGAINGTGNSLDNLIRGNAAANRLDGGAGADTLEGGAGNDSYLVDQTGDVVTEVAGGGSDTVSASISFSFGISGRAELEHLTLLGSGHLNGTGNAKANRITGNSGNNTLGGGTGNDTLVGGAGADTLTGGSGADQFKFVTLGSGTDRILDFSRSGGDTLSFVSANFGALPIATLSASRFLANSDGRALTSTQRFIFETDTRILRFDPDGNGVRASVEIARLNINNLAAGDLRIVAS